MGKEKYGNILYLSDFSELGYYVREHFINAKKDFLQIEKITDVNENEKNIIKHYNTLVFISYHFSEKQKPSFCIHHTGNWEESWGGKEETLSIALPFLLKGCFLYLEEFSDIPVTLEVTHHGPTIDKKIIFLEIFKEYYSEKRADLLVDVALRLPEEKGIITFGVGGNHYCASFNRRIKEEYAIGHIIPKYKNIKEKTFIQAIEKVFPKKTELVLVDKKGTKSEQRNKIKELCNKYNIDILFF